MEIFTLIARSSDTGEIVHVEMYDRVPAIGNDMTVEWDPIEQAGLVTVLEGTSNWGSDGTLLNVYQGSVNGGDTIDITEDILVTPPLDV